MQRVIRNERLREYSGKTNWIVSVKTMKHMKAFFIAVLLPLLLMLWKGDQSRCEEDEIPHRIKPAISIQSGLLLQPPLDLSQFTTQDFVTASSTVGLEKIHKKWTSPVTVLPPHSRTKFTA